jgi:ATP-dependent exoDNAse (exonuclease V) beta subunit
MQWNNLKPLLLNSMAEGGNTMVVGDVKQSIYRWRNGDWRILAYRLDDDFRIFNRQHLNLDTNWRSSEAIVKFNNRIFSELPQRLQEKLNVDLNKNEIPEDEEYLYTAITHAYSNALQQVSSKHSDKEGYVYVAQLSGNDELSTTEEALQCLPQLISELLTRGYRSSDIALLARSNKQGQSIAKILLEHGFNIISQDSLFLNRSLSVQFIIAVLHQSVHPNDAINQALINNYIQRLDKPLINYDAEIVKITCLSLTEAIEHIIRVFDFSQLSGEMSFIQELHDLMLKHAAKETNDIYSFLEWWQDNNDKLTLSINDEQDAIRILTIHKSKGLQFRVVILPFCSWNLDQKPG